MTWSVSSQLNLLFFCAVFCFSGTVVASCNQMEWKRGKPFDYYAPETRASTGTFRGGLLHLVDNYHLTPDVRNLVRGATGAMPGDLLFVLNTIPNHPVALDAYSRYERRYLESALFREQKFMDRPVHTADCLFERADRVFPNMAETKVVWAIHRYRSGRYEDAEVLLLQAITLQPNYVEAHYNLGLVYVALNQLASAQKHADIAYAAGYPLPGLKKKLARLGQE